MNEQKFLQFLAKHDKGMAKYYTELIDELARIGVTISDLEKDSVFSFDSHPQTAEKIKKALEKYQTALQTYIVEGMKTAIDASFAATSQQLDKYTALSDKAVETLRNRTKNAWIAARMRPVEGLSLSQNVWNYTYQTKSEFEMAMGESIADGIAEGISAEELGRRVRGKLQNPDAMYRRYHLKKTMADGTKKDIVQWRKRTIDADGKVHFMSTDIEHPGRGVYRSSRQNALRLAATEINTAYRYADCVRWQSEPYVLGIRIQLSGNHTLKGPDGIPHPFYDICDDLAGDYPKWFLWKGWHPRCRCTMTPIMMDEEEFEKVMAMPEEERNNYVSPNLIKDLPENFKQYISDNAERIEKSIQRGTQPWWMKDNFIDGDVFKGRNISPIPRNTAPGSVQAPGATPAQIKKMDTVSQVAREDGAILSPQQLAEVMDVDRAQYSQEILTNLDELDAAFGVSRGTSMSWELANKGAENPNYWLSYDYQSNCSTCVMTHELRRRGFNITARGEKAFGSTGVDWKERFLNADGSAAEFEYIRDWVTRKPYKVVTRKVMNEYFDEVMSEDGRYEIYCAWDSAKKAKMSGAHVFMAEKKNGKVTFFDPQTGKSGADIEWYFENMANRDVYAMRVDDKIINPKVAKSFSAKEGIVDGTEYELHKTPIDIAKEKRHANRNVLAIQENAKVRAFLGKEERDIFGMLNAVAKAEHLPTLEYSELYRPNYDSNGNITSVDIRESLLHRTLFDAYQNYKKVVSDFAKIDTSVGTLGLKRSKALKAFIEVQREKAISSIKRRKTTWVDAPYYARKKFKSFVAERDAIRKQAQEREEKMNAASASPKVKDPTKAHSYAELKKILGDDMPPILEEYEKSIQRTGFTRREYLAEADEIEAKLKDFFENVITGYGHFTQLANVADDSRILSGYGIWNTQIEVAQGAASKDGYFMNRCGWAEFAYKPVSSRRSTTKQHWKPGEYYRCAAPLETSDPTHWYVGQNTSYGGGKLRNAMVLFRNDRIVTTFTIDNSYQTNQIASLTCDPKVVSIDGHSIRNSDAASYTSVAQIKGSSTNYLEAQVYPFKSRNGVLGPNEIKAIILPKHPSTVYGATPGVWDKWYEAHVDVYYYDSKSGKVVLYKAGKPEETPEQRKARIDARNKKRKADRLKMLASRGETMEEAVNKVQAQRAKIKQAAKANVEQLMKVAGDVENADLSLDNVRAWIAKGDYIRARKFAEEARQSYASLKARRDAMKDYIPNVDDFHKRFTIDEIEAAYKAVKNDFSRWEREAPGDLNHIIDRASFQRNYVEAPQKYKAGRTRHKTWEIAQEMCDKKISEVRFTIKKNDAIAALKDLRTYKTSDVINKLVKEADALIASGDIDGALVKIEEGNQRRLKLQTRKLTSTIEKLKVGESSRRIFDSELFTQAKKDAAQWFTKDKYGDMNKAYKAADDYMSHYAEELWATLSKEEKMVLWLYTDGSKYINEEILGVYCNVVESVIDGTLRNGLEDGNTLTSIIEKAPPLTEGLWLQNAQTHGAFQAIFGKSLSRYMDPSDLIGVEGVDSIFMSTHACRDGAFTKGVNTGSTNNVILSIYAPEGTKGVYMEPFSSYGDGRNPYRRGKQGFYWTGEKLTDPPSDQVEYLLQRGTKFRITKAKYENGMWYIDADIIEQTAVSALNTSIPGLKRRRLRPYDPYR